MNHGFLNNNVNWREIKRAIPLIVTKCTANFSQEVELSEAILDPFSYLNQNVRTSFIGFSSIPEISCLMDDIADAMFCILDWTVFMSEYSEYDEAVE